MFQESELCNEICFENQNFTFGKETYEMVSNGLLLETSKQMPVKDSLELKNEIKVLPLANSYIATYLITIVCAAIVSNCVVLTVFGLRRKKLHTFQICLISVCISDLLFSLLLHPMSIATALGYDAERIFNHSGCLYFGVLALFFGSFDMVIHSVIAVLRYINVCHPARIQCLSKRTISALIVICVFYSMVWCIGPVFGIGKYVTFEVGCTMAFADSCPSSRTFVNCAFIFIFFIPLTVTISSYVGIIIQASKQRRLLERMGTETTVGYNRLAVELKLVRLTSVIAAAYIIVWLPYAVVCLSEAYGDVQSIPWIFRILAALFCKTGTATNPVIYLFMSKGFRRETVETIRVLLKCRTESFASNLLYSSSQKSSSYRSQQSQVSLRSSWRSRIKREEFSIQRKAQSSLITKSDLNRSSSNPIETSV